jgi:hypothetical protein
MILLNSMDYSFKIWLLFLSFNLIECQNGVDLSTLLKSCLKTAIDNKYLAKEGRSIKLGEKAASIDIAAGSSS